MSLYRFHFIAYDWKGIKLESHLITSLSDDDLHTLIVRFGSPGQICLYISDGAKVGIHFLPFFRRITNCFFSRNKKKSIQALHAHLQNAGLDFAQFLLSLEKIPSEIDREKAFEKFGMEVRKSLLDFFIKISLQP